MEIFTARNAAKYAVQAIIATKTTKLAEETIIDHTRFEEDDTVVTISSHLVGWYVASKLKPVTDRVVDRTADFVSAKREARKARKNDTTTE